MAAPGQHLHCLFLCKVQFSADAFYLGADHFSRGENQLITRFCIAIRTIGIGSQKPSPEALRSQPERVSTRRPMPWTLMVLRSFQAA